MATAVADSYSAASGVPVGGGRWAGGLFGGSITLDGVVAGGSMVTFNPLNDVLNLIAATPVEGWVQLNTNTFQSAFPPDDLRALYGGNPAPPERIQGAWPSMGWDSVDHQLVLWGGGHANTSANEPYVWRCDTRQWHLAYHASEMVQVDAYPIFRSAGFNDAPISSHTYGNNEFLTVQNRFWTFGGSAHGHGGKLIVFDPNIPGDQPGLRNAGGFSLSLAQARQGKVAGATGTNNKRGAYVGVNLDGANAWRLHDWWSKSDAENKPRFGGANYSGHTECGSAATVESARDVLYYTAAAGTDRALLRVEFVDSNPLNDIHTQVSSTAGDGTGSEGARGNGALAMCQEMRLAVMVMGGNNNGQTLRFVDLKRTWGSTNTWRTPGLTGADVAEFAALTLHRAGIVWNPIKACFTVWHMGAQVWEVYPPAGNPTPDAGWTLVKVTMAGGAAPRSNFITSGLLQEYGIIGKWKWASDLRCAITTFGSQAGEVWAYKPTGWTDPRA